MLFILRARTNPGTFINAVLLEKKVEWTEWMSTARVSS